MQVQGRREGVLRRQLPRQRRHQHLHRLDRLRRPVHKQHVQPRKRQRLAQHAHTRQRRHLHGHGPRSREDHSRRATERAWRLRGLLRRPVQARPVQRPGQIHQREDLGALHLRHARTHARCYDCRLRQRLLQGKFRRRRRVQAARGRRCVAREEQLGRRYRGVSEQELLGQRRGWGAHGVFLALVL